MKFPHIEGVILLGGKSERMGTDKYLLPFFDTTLGQRLADELLSVCAGVRCSAKRPNGIGINDLPVHQDVYETDSALAGIHAGLRFAMTEWSFVTACDLPFFTRGVVEILAQFAQPDVDAVIPRKNGFWEPLCALYSQRCLRPITQMLDQGMFEVKQLFPQIRIQPVEADDIEQHTHPHVFFNMNTREDYDFAIKLYPSLPKIK